MKTTVIDKAVICASINLGISINNACEIIKKATDNGSFTTIFNDKVISVTHRFDNDIDDDNNELITIIIRDKFEERFCLNTRFVGKLFTSSLADDLQDFFNSDVTLANELLDFFKGYAQLKRDLELTPDLNERFYHIFTLNSMDNWMPTKRYTIIDRTPIECVVR